MNRRHTCFVFLAGLAYAILGGSETATASPASTASLAAVHSSGAGHLTINRLPNVGGAMGAFISIDGLAVGRIGYGESYHGSLAPGDHLISITRYPNYMVLGPTEKRLSVQSGQSYTLTLSWKGDRLVLM